MITSKKISFFVIPFLLFAWSVNASEITGGLSNQGITPIAPLNMTASKTGGSQITVTWSGVAGVDGYKIYRKKDVGNFELIAENITVLNYVNSGLSNGVYSYQIQPFLGSLSPDLNNILPTTPISIVVATSSPIPIPTPTPASSGDGGGGGGGGGGGTIVQTPTNNANKKVDTNNDSKVDVLDFVTLMANWGKTGTSNTADFNNDNKVDILDFVTLMANWTK